eukprot:361825-Chlamydomonas_euryale.AAC.3
MPTHPRVAIPMPACSCPRQCGHALRPCPWIHVDILYLINGLLPAAAPAAATAAIARGSARRNPATVVALVAPPAHVCCPRARSAARIVRARVLSSGGCSAVTWLVRQAFMGKALGRGCRRLAGATVHPHTPPTRAEVARSFAPRRSKPQASADCGWK